MTDETLKTTPLNAAHKALGARMVPFGGWEMPVQYAGVIEEHLAVREQAGLFEYASAHKNRWLADDVESHQVGQGERFEGLKVEWLAVFVYRKHIAVD